MNIPNEVQKRNEDAQLNLRDMRLSQEEIDQLLGIVTESYTDNPNAAQKMQLYNEAQAKINDEDKEKNRLLDEKIARDMRNNIGFTEFKKQYMYLPENVAKRAAEEAANEKYRLEKMEIFNNRPENRMPIPKMASSLVLPNETDEYHFRPISPRTNMASREGSPRPVGNVSPSEMIVEKGGKIRRTKRNRKSRKSKKSWKSKKSRKSKKYRKYRKH